MNPNIQMPSAKTVISTAASMAATAMLIRSFAKDFIPHELREYILNKFRYFLSTLTNEITIIIDEYDGLHKNQLFSATEIYVGSLVSPSSKIFRASLPKKEKKIHVSMERNEEIKDKFCGFHLKWKFISEKTRARYVTYPDDFNSTMVSEVRFFKLCFHKKHNNQVLDEYLPFVLERSKVIEQETRTLKLFTLKNERMHGRRTNPWQSVNLEHPATFDTLAMDTEIKNTIIDDLNRFVSRREFYRKVGKAWKRGYLLFGPPGTGKSSLIAAMANYLNFDVYDLELTDLRCNSDFRRLLISTANRSILVVEDIDASIALSERQQAPSRPRPMYPYEQNQGPEVTLSGLLNFIDGLWSSCGDERIIVFTTNHKEKLDPALLRPGRMDVHIHMSYCTPCGFKMLVSNYLGLTEHQLVTKIEQLIGTTKVTPAEVGEQLLKNDDPEVTLRGLMEFLERKKESEEAKADQENREVTKTEVVPEPEEKDGENSKLKDSKSMKGLKQYIEMVKASPPDAREQLIKKDEAVMLLKGLIELLEEKNEAEDAKARVTESGESKSDNVPESQKEIES